MTNAATGETASKVLPTAPALTRRYKTAYGIGSMAEAVVISSTTQFLLIFYNQVQHLPAGAIGLAIAAGLAVNGIVDPIVGSWSDRTTSRWGRRHPFMFAAAIPVAVTFWALFNPPEWPEWGKLTWLCCFNIFFQQALTAFHTPHLALGGELTTDYIERTRVMSFNTFFLWAGDTLCWLTTFGLFFRSSASYTNGALDPSRYAAFSATTASLVLAILFASSYCTRSRIPWLPKATPGSGAFNVRAFYGDVRQALSNRNYIVLLIGALFLSLMQGVRGGLWIYTATYFWRLTSAQITWFALGSFLSYVAGSTIVAPLHRTLEKRWTGAIAVLVYSIGPALPLTLGYFGILSSENRLLLPILIAFSLLQHLPYSLLTTTVFSAFADIADENELRYGARQQGILYSTQTFFARIDQAVGAALAGWVLTLVAFPTNAVVGHVPSAVLNGLAIAFVISTVPGLLAAISYAKLGVSAKSHAATRSALDAR